MTGKPGQILTYVAIPWTGQDEEIDDKTAAMFPGTGEFVVFTGKNGYDSEQADARTVFFVGQVLEVFTCEIGMSKSYLTFAKVPGSWNSVMFDILEGYTRA